MCCLVLGRMGGQEACSCTMLQCVPCTALHCPAAGHVFHVQRCTAPQVMRRAHWDEEREVWVLERLSDVGRRDGGAAKRPMSAAGARRPVTDFAKAVAAAGDMNPRFRSENILSLELDLPERTTADFEAGVPEAQVQVGAAGPAFAAGSITCDCECSGVLLHCLGVQRLHQWLALFKMVGRQVCCAAGPAGWSTARQVCTSSLTPACFHACMLVPWLIAAHTASCFASLGIFSCLHLPE
jgi:hypothetical protein